jgi:cytochrome P450
VLADVPSLIEDFDHTSPAVAEHFYDVMKLMRQRCPVAHSSRFGGFWALSRYGDVKAVARDADSFKSGSGVTIPHFGASVPVIPLEVDPPDHIRYRRFLLPWFTPQAVSVWEEQVRAVVVETLMPHLSVGRCDLVHDLADRVPPVAIAGFLGLPAEDWSRFRHWTETLLGLSYREDVASQKGAAKDLESYLLEMILAKRGGDGTDLLTAIANADLEGRLLSDAELIGITQLLTVAGHETTVSASANILLYLVGDTELRDRLAADPTLIPAAVEEALRYDSPVTGLARTAARETTLGGCQVRPGDRLLLLWGAANRDEDEFDEPDKFLIDRPRMNHLAFGIGPHRCLGEHLARLELRVIVEEVLRRMPDYQLQPGVEIQRVAGNTRGVVSLPVVFSPTGA